MIVMLIHLILAIMGLIIEVVPLLFYILFVPGYFFADLILYTITHYKPSLFGLVVPKSTLSVYL